jgi:uncharacterized Zn finger protein
VAKPNRTATLPTEDTVCFKCRRETVVKAVLPVGLVVYLRCEECGSAWSIAERRAIARTDSEADRPATAGLETKKGSLN